MMHGPVFPWKGTLVALASFLIMAAGSVWRWPQLSAGVHAPQRDGSTLLIDGWLFAVLMPLLLVVVSIALLFAQPLRRRFAEAASVPLWRTDATNRWTTTMSLMGVSVTFIGLHALLLSLSAAVELSVGLGVLSFCLGLLVIIIGNYIGKLAPLSDDQRAFFPERFHGFIDGYRDAFHRAARRLAWPFIALGMITCILAFFAPLVAVFAPVLAALSMLGPLVVGVVNGISRHGGSVPFR